MNPADMSKLSVRSASEAAIGIATLRAIASSNSDLRPSLSAMAAEIIADSASARPIRATIQVLANQQHEWLKERATHATISPRVNERRSRELESIAAVHAATIATLRLVTEASGSPDAAHELQEAFVTAIRGVDEVPMGVSTKRALREQLMDEVHAAAYPQDRQLVSSMLTQAEQIYLERIQQAVLEKYQSNDSDSPSL